MSDRLAPAPLLPDEALDRIALHKLAWTYCHAVDRRDLVLLRSLYHDDAVDDHGPMFCGSADAFVAWLPQMLANWRATIHTITTMQFLIAGEAAEGELANTAWHLAHDGQREITAHGRYLDQYRKREGVWKFYRRALVLDRLEDRPAPPAAAAGLGEGIALGQPGAADPVYQRLPMFRAARGQC